MQNKPNIKMKSLEKALLVLNCFTRQPVLGVTEISEMLGLYKSNVHNILSTLKAMNYIEQDEESGKYRLSIAVFNLSRALGQNFIISKIASPYMQELADQVNERVYLGIQISDEVVYLDSMYPKESFNLMRAIAGERAKLYCTGIGKAMLATLPPDQIEKCIPEKLIAYTDYTITDRDALLKELEITKKRGYSIDHMEHEFGVKCVGMPIFNKQRKLEGAISISGPASRLTDERLEECAILLKLYITKIEERL